jgi:hypothetical protein
VNILAWNLRAIASGLMKNFALKYIVPAGFLLSVTLTVQAIPIVGGISLSGNVTYPVANINAATAFQSFSGVTVSSVSGSYLDASVAAGTGVSMSAFSFNPFAPAGIIPLWQTTSGTAASFDLTSLGPITQGNGFLILTGEGTLHLDGFDNTPGYWRFSSQQGDTTFAFSSSNGALTPSDASVPDGGTTVILLGATLSGLALIRRKLS